MCSDVLRDRLDTPDIQPFSIILVNGERIDVRDRDSLAYPFTTIKGRRVFSPYVVFVQADGEAVVTRSISVPMIAQVVDKHRLNGN